MKVEDIGTRAEIKGRIEHLSESYVEVTGGFVCARPTGITLFNDLHGDQHNLKCCFTT